jgi:hypothetical protein
MDEDEGFEIVAGARVVEEEVVVAKQRAGALVRHNIRVRLCDSADSGRSVAVVGRNIGDCGAEDDHHKGAVMTRLRERLAANGEER